MIDIIKFVAAAIILGFGIVAFYLFPEYSTLLRTIGILITTVVSAFIIYQTERGKILFGFVVAARQELHKIVWPSKKEANQTTLIVIVAVIVLGILLWGIDSLLAASLRWLIG